MTKGKQLSRDPQLATRGPLLITSFRSWRSHQSSNSSHDLIAAMSAAGQLPERTIWLSQVPVSFAIAPIRVINAMYRFRPRAVVCCGMAEKRAYLSLEQQGKGTDQNLQTCLNLADLLMDTRLSKISDDAGDYVCNTLYYRVLEAIQAQAILHRRGSANATPCLFVHVPVLSASTQALIQSDMHSVLNKVSE